jgi:hypothetical protein
LIALLLELLPKEDGFANTTPTCIVARGPCSNGLTAVSTAPQSFFMFRVTGVIPGMKPLMQFVGLLFMDGFRPLTLNVFAPRSSHHIMM